VYNGDNIGGNDSVRDLVLFSFYAATSLLPVALIPPEYWGA
jgi:hypothetical protein